MCAGNRSGFFCQEDLALNSVKYFTQHGLKAMNVRFITINTIYYCSWNSLFKYFMTVIYTYPWKCIRFTGLRCAASEVTSCIVRSTATELHPEILINGSYGLTIKIVKNKGEKISKKMYVMQKNITEKYYWNTTVYTYVVTVIIGSYGEFIFTVCNFLSNP